MIFAALTAIPTWARYLLAALLLIIGALIYVENIRRDAHEEGAREERTEQQAKVIENVEKAKKAADAVSTDPAIARDLCLRYARNPESC